MLNLAIAPNATDSRVVLYEPALQVLPLTGYLGTALQFTGTTTNGDLAAGATDRYALVLRGSEIASTPMDQVLVGIELRAATGSGLNPALPQLAGRTPLATQTTTAGAFALFALDTEGLELLELAGLDAATAGAYTVRVEVSGDLNADGKVDGVDAQQTLAALGTGTGDPGFVPAADADRNGRIEPADVQMLGSNFGFLANRPPVTSTSSVTTHVELEVTIPLTGLVFEPEDDAVFFRVENALNGRARLAGDGSSVTFTAESDFSGQAAFDLLADDGFGTSNVSRVTVDVGDAPLLRLRIEPRALLLDFFDTANLKVTGDFTDASGAPLPLSYLTVTLENPEVVTISPTGVVRPFPVAVDDPDTVIPEVSTLVTVSRDGISATATIGVGDTAEGYPFFDQDTLEVFPLAITLPVGGTRQLSVSYPDPFQDVTAGEQGTSYISSNPSVVEVSPDGLITAIGTGDAVVTVVPGFPPVDVRVLVTEPKAGPALVDAAGGIIEAADGSMIAIAPGALDGERLVSLEPVMESDLPFQAPPGFNFGGAFRLDLGGQTSMNSPAQLAIPMPPGAQPGDEVYLFRAGTAPDDNGDLVPAWWQVESGVVGPDGIARTQSPPFPGVEDEGMYYVGYQSGLGVGRVRGKILATLPITGIDFPTALAVAALTPGAPLVAAPLLLLSQFVLSFQVGVIQLKVIQYNAEELPEIIGSTQVEIKPKQTVNFETTVQVAPSTGSSRPTCRPAKPQEGWHFRHDGGSGDRPKRRW